MEEEEILETLDDLLKITNDELFDIFVDFLEEGTQEKARTDILMQQYLNLSVEEFVRQTTRLEKILSCFTNMRDRFDVISLGIGIKEKDLPNLIGWFFKMKDQNLNTKDLLNNFFALYCIPKSNWEIEYNKSKKGMDWLKENKSEMSSTDISPFKSFLKFSVDRKTYECVKRWAYQGDFLFLYILGELYYAGDVIKNDKKSIKWWIKAAEKGHRESQYRLGCAYFYGEGATKSKTESEKWFTKAAEQGCPRSKLNLHIVKDDNESMKKERLERIKHWMPFAEEGNEKAQFNLGVAYHKGIDRIDKLEAIKWWTKSAEQGYVLSRN